MSDKEKNLFKPAAEYKETPNLIADLQNEMESRSDSQLKDEAAALDLEMKQLDIELKRDQVASIKAKRNAALEIARTKYIATMQFLANREANQKRCNHRKGGRGPDAVMRGQGSAAEYAIIHHGLPNGGLMALCQRCNKEWHPANRWNTEGGVLKPIPATEGWEWAIGVNTDNSPSRSSTFLFEKEMV